MFTPPVWMSTVEWFTNVTSRRSPSTVDGGSEVRLRRSSLHFAWLRVSIQRSREPSPRSGGALGVKNRLPLKWSLRR
jgi:hypothetical protein